MRRVSRLAEEFLASEEGLCSMELIKIIYSNLYTITSSHTVVEPHSWSFKFGKRKYLALSMIRTAARPLS
jgi:hypothetical protein